MRKSRLFPSLLLFTSLGGIMALGAWNFVQVRLATQASQERWVGRVAQMVLAERLSAGAWVEKIPAEAPRLVRTVARSNTSVAGVFLVDTKTHDMEHWIRPGLEGLEPMDPRLVVLETKALEARSSLLGPVLMIEGVPYHTLVRPLDSRQVLVVVQEMPGLTSLLEQETRLWRLQVFVYDYDQHPIFVAGDLSSVRGAVSQMMTRVRTGQASGRVFLERRFAWQWLATFHYAPSLDWVFIVTQPMPLAYGPFLVFLLSLVALVLLVGAPWRAAEALRRAREAQDLSQFAQRIDHFVRGKDVMLSEPPYPFKELTPVVQSLRWLLPQWKKAEAFPRELAMERKLLLLLIESLPEGILFFNAQGVLSLGNELGRVFLALQQEAGREYKMMSGVQVPRGFLEPFAEPIFTGAQKNVGKEVEVGWADGKHLYRVWVEVVENDGQVEGFIVVVRDITFRKQWEYVQEQVLSGITHDLRGPLSAIMGYLDLLRRQIKDGPPKVVEYVNLAREAGVRLTQMVSDILDVVRFEQGKIDLQLEAISVDDMFRRLQNIFGVTATQKNVGLKLHLAQPGLLVSGDPKLLQRVLDNLVSNAIKFTPAGGTIAVSAARGPSRIIFEVGDTGRGIPKEAQSRIFDKFQQVRPGDRSAGYGLGLAVSKFIVEAHKGEIRVESEVGQGSRFTFWIPDQPVSAPARLSP